MAERKTFALRISKDLWDEVQRMAAQELRSVNAQIEFMLRDAVSKRGRRLDSENKNNADS